MEQGALHWVVVDLFHYRSLRRLKSRAIQKRPGKNLTEDICPNTYCTKKKCLSWECPSSFLYEIQHRRKGMTCTEPQLCGRIFLVQWSVLGKFGFATVKLRLHSWCTFNALFALAYQPQASSTFISEQTSNQPTALFSQNESATKRTGSNCEWIDKPCLFSHEWGMSYIMQHVLFAKAICDVSTRLPRLSLVLCSGFLTLRIGTGRYYTTPMDG
jgi:hypothetical protein